MRVVVKVFVATVVFWYHTVMNTVNQLAKKYGLELVLLFGSRADGSQREKSDFDIAYSSLKPLAFMEENKMAIALHEVCKTSDVDIMNISNAGPLLLKQIVDEGVVLYEAKESIFNNLYLYAMNQYRESAVLNELRRSYVLLMANRFKMYAAIA